jgi:hypothetical protein
LLAMAGRGAVAGLIGGVALAATDRLAAPRLTGGTARGRKWDRQVVKHAGAIGVRVPRRRASAAGVATSLAYAALLGAVYAVARERFRGLGAATGMLDAALGYGVSVVVPRRSRPLRGPKVRRFSGQLAARADDPELFRRVTTMALWMLA